MENTRPHSGDAPLLRRLFGERDKAGVCHG
jgi:hypothetical protein